MFQPWAARTSGCLTGVCDPGSHSSSSGSAPVLLFRRALPELLPPHLPPSFLILPRPLPLPLYAWQAGSIGPVCELEVWGSCDGGFGVALRGKVWAAGQRHLRGQWTVLGDRLGVRGDERVISVVSVGWWKPVALQSDGLGLQSGFTYILSDWESYFSSLGLGFASVKLR